MIIAVDFDGTIVEHKYPEIGQEIPGAIYALRRLSQSHKIILWTVRQGDKLDEAVDYCAKKGLKFYAVNCDTPGGCWDGKGARKLRADMFIDDANLGGLPDWEVIYEMVMNHQTFGDVLQGEAFSDSHKRRHKKKRRSLLGRLVDRCRNARTNLRGGHYSRHW